MSVGSFSSGMECEIEGCALTKCMSERSKEGGGMKMCLKRGELELKVRGCSLVMCMYSTADGRGGGLIIVALDPKGRGAGAFGGFGVRLEGMRFMMNDAHEGKDVFIRCDSIDLLLNVRLFDMDFSQDALKSNNSICGRDDIEKVDVDLISLITFLYSVQVFVNANGSDSTQCGAQEKPNQSIWWRVRHI
ncbi:uncharacterized protein MONOS_12791 [Monocercomonoides exilis]|uniref:uncharacterized protein n=1 Tax=Monocercomonoides exilis TaxID=2049356 RepID=UPI003559BA12|nr:hypothetical protein MONOS_12791 [Monocercomonoides exilis]|eukprot:MONOS_12791.1-p1 / transcript=MONOS_12791.1 / gene=MONOS_12791 / organism=Monocercomonoides_exilis_PA203 / gene_product=unspecified product / transcript_product=unspecified product / location=Mono_scaffold00733:18936-19505(+) / protein_length=190 / sequence_SO=supercontig / SO=protein_coding / is_pseudo=false